MRFYGADRFLAASVTDFVIRGLLASEICIVLASAEHLVAIESGIEAAGLDLSDEQYRSCFLPLEVSKALSALLKDGEPDEFKLAAWIDAASRGDASGKQVRVYQELVAELSISGDKAASLRMEEIWFEIGRKLQLTLYSYYTPSERVAGADTPGNPYKVEIESAGEEPFVDIQTQRLHDPAYLRQQAEQLETELNELNRTIAKRYKVQD